MYLVVHEDAARGAAIVRALGGGAQARLVRSSYDAMRFAETQGPPQAVLACPDAVDTGIATIELPAEPDVQGVPILYDGGRRGPVYRAFVRQWRARMPFHHLRGATPEEAAAALQRLGPELPWPVPRPRKWLVLAWFLPWLASIVVAFGSPGLLPPAIERRVLFAPTVWMLLRQAAEPIAAALAHRIRPSWGALAFLVLAFVLPYSLLR